MERTDLIVDFAHPKHEKETFSPEARDHNGPGSPRSCGGVFMWTAPCTPYEKKRKTYGL